MAESCGCLPGLAAGDGGRLAAEGGQPGAAIRGPVVEQQERAGVLEPGPDPLPSGQGKIEKGERTPAKEFAAACDAVPELDTGGMLTLVRNELRENLLAQAYPGWFHRWPDAEEQAHALRWYEPLLVPGLLQTEDYARAVLRGAQANATDDQIEQQVAARMERQDVLAGDNPPYLWAVVDEGVLHRCIGSAEIMRDQLAHLAQMCGRPKASIQVIPFSAGARAGLLGAFITADLDGGSILYLETATTGQVVDAPHIVRDAGLIFDTLRCEALPREASRDMITKVAEKRWT